MLHIEVYRSWPKTRSHHGFGRPRLSVTSDDDSTVPRTPGDVYSPPNIVYSLTLSQPSRYRKFPLLTTYFIFRLNERGEIAALGGATFDILT